ncbi:unnamed protein product [Phyllotreta striolata]|uniref:HAUS augmin-like complex subunit 6 N-terminal domain-containing protein n=1 Tax=Phyllotreta striolata TaxID=444603 RepID=A0A9N9TE22_PHYSR|nr:unnamed protein product [Phyllotreta striolata]
MPLVIGEDFHEILYNQIRLLTQFYPPTPAFNLVFKKDFSKSNKANEIYEVVYYLLNILDPVMTKKKLPSWPLISRDDEINFKKELLEYINSLNDLYEYANIPNIMLTHVILPTKSSRFMECMLLLTRLVLSEVLRNKFRRTVCLPLADESESFRKHYLSIEADNARKLRDFQELLKDKEEEHKANEKTVRKVDEEMRESVSRLNSANMLFVEKYPIYANLGDKFEALHEMMRKIQQINELSKSCKALQSYLDDTNLVLEVNNETSSNQVSSLLEFIKALTHLLQSKLSFKLPTPSCSEISSNSNTLYEIEKDFVILRNALTIRKEQTQLMIKQIDEM